MDPIALGDAERSLLLPGEVPLALEMATMMSSADRSGKAAKPRAVERFSVDPVVGGFEAEEGYFDAKLSGIGVEGQAGSIASAFASAVGVTNRVFLTSGRMLVLELAEPAVRFQCARSDIAGVRAVPRLLQFGRLELAFRDGSVARPSFGMVLTRAATRFRRALAAGAPHA